ncbi:MAG: exodeoxyribonuclease VII large subunit, partial [Candidatus Aminicenantes bacterium]|nr:exodeoxyribonuclease VII large subunit [Candidatus Aminicenantes bacterium]
MEGFVKPDKVYTVSELTRLVKTELENAFPMLWVEGEISNFHRHHSGHLYFTLKDEISQLRTVMFRSDAKRVPFELKDGLQVVARGRINVYEPRGEYQLVVELLEPKGKGALQLAFEQLKEKLQKEGLFDPARKKKLPLLPKKVGVVTSPRGAAVVDIIRTLERRFARLHILLYPVKVQGEGAAEEIVEGIDYLGKLPGIDVMIVGRGGGSIEDLWAFNEEKVARAIFRCPIPVISAVGHEIDFTIADFVADIRASTPSVAAEIVIKEEESLRERIENLEKRLVHNQRYYLQEQRHEVLSLTQHRAFQNMKITLMNLAQKVDELDMRAWNAIRNRQQKISEDKFRTELLEEKIRGALKEMLQQFQARWETLSAQLHNLSP